jgi:hypothetical protein
MGEIFDLGGIPLWVVRGSHSPMRQMIKENTTLRRLYYRLRMARSKGQSDESRIIADLAKDAPRTFVEFGFHPIEFNCAELARDPEWRGLLIDGNARQVEDARSLFSDRIKIVEAFLTRDNLEFIKSTFAKIGVLSIDVDGNDYWFLEKLIDTEPGIVCVEYNSSFGLEPITIPYDPAFDRHQKHPRGWYHGASLTALAKLCASRGYGLAAVSNAGLNAFFTKSGRLDPKTEWRPNALRERYSGIIHEQQWKDVRSMPFEHV